MYLLAQAVALFINILTVLIFARILFSWFRPRYRNRSNQWFFKLDELVWRATEPLLGPIRNILPTGSIGLDFSPWILLLLVRLIGGWLIQALI